MRAKHEDEAPASKFESLVRRNSRFVFKVAYAVLRNPHDAEEVVQETFMSLFKSGAWLQMKDERAFLARAAWRQAVDRIRSNPNRFTEEADELLEIPSREADPERVLLDADSHAAVHRLIDALPEELRQPLALSSIQEMNSRAIAEILGIPEGTVRTRLMRAREMLKRKLSAQLEIRYAK